MTAEPRVRKPFRLNVSKEWCMKMAASEGDTEISAGVPEEVRATPTTLADALTEIEKLHSIYIQACTGRAEFRNALRDSRATIASQAEALAAMKAEMEMQHKEIRDADDALILMRDRAEAAEAALKAAREALDNIANGQFPGASRHALAGNWHGIVEQLQGMARAAYAVETRGPDA